MAPARVPVGPFALRPVDLPVLGGLAALAAAAAGLGGRVAEGPTLAARTLAVAAAYLGAIWIESRLRARPLRAALRLAAVTLALSYLFGAVAPLQLVIHGRWLDRQVLDLEQAVFGVQPTAASTT